MLARFLLLALLLLSAGCLAQSTSAEKQDDSPEDPLAPAGEAMECQNAMDCTLAASTCCECPSFAAPVSQGYADGCEDVDCELQGVCPAVEAVCDEGRCVLICSPVTSDKVCDDGFRVDDAGCLLDECASDGLSGTDACILDEDCVRTAADCCGCVRGGTDTAVLASELVAFQEGMACPDDPTCPDIDICTDEIPRCVLGSCVLVGSAPDDEAPETLCGTPRLGPCAEGQICVLNAPQANDASRLGVGVCRPE